MPHWVQWRRRLLVQAAVLCLSPHVPHVSWHWGHVWVRWFHPWHLRQCISSFLLFSTYTLSWQMTMPSVRILFAVLVLESVRSMCPFVCLGEWWYLGFGQQADTMDPRDMWLIVSKSCTSLTFSGAKCSRTNCMTRGNFLALILAPGAKFDRNVRWCWAVLTQHVTSSEFVSSRMPPLLRCRTLVTVWARGESIARRASLAFFTMSLLAWSLRSCSPWEGVSIRI